MARNFIKLFPNVYLYSSTGPPTGWLVTYMSNVCTLTIIVVNLYHMLDPPHLF